MIVGQHLEVSGYNQDHVFTWSLDEQLPLLHVEDHRTILERTGSIAHLCFRQIALFSNLLRYRFSSYEDHKHIFLEPQLIDEQLNYDPEDFPWIDDDESAGLTLFVHGLFSTPLVWGEFLNHMYDQNPDVHFVAPIVVNRGNCPLACASRPILSMINHYLQKFPGRPITLIGTSNGSRINADIESQLEVNLMQGRTLRVVSIAGVHYGTRVMNFLKEWFIASAIQIHPQLIQEMLWQSPFAVHFLNDQRNKQRIWAANGIETKHLFCTTLEDEKVTRSSTVPHLPFTHSTYHVHHGENHQTVVHASLEGILTWLNE